MIDAFLNIRSPIWVTASPLARQGKKTDEGTMMSPAPKSNLAAVAVWPEMQILTPATTKKASDILINSRIEFCVETQKLRGLICPAINWDKKIGT
jgi:hypothetical protein